MRLPLKSLLLIGLIGIAPAHAEPPAKVQIEVSFLLGFMDGSGCEFLRNGSWHDSKSAQEHLREKYNFLVSGDLIKTTNDFIELAASESSMTGIPYQVKCDGTAIPSKQWLRAELTRLRSF